MKRNVRNLSILVTGASRGIGRRTALALARAGAQVTVTSRSADEINSLVSEIRAMGGEAEAIPVDLLDPLQRELLVSSAVESFGGLDVLVNCAGISSFGEFATSTPEILRHVMEMNFFVPSELIRLCQPYLYESAKRGRKPAVVNVASICGRAGIPSLSEPLRQQARLRGPYRSPPRRVQPLRHRCSACAAGCGEVGRPEPPPAPQRRSHLAGIREGPTSAGSSRCGAESAGEQHPREGPWAA